MKTYPNTTFFRNWNLAKLKPFLTFLLVLLFSYAALSKLLDLRQFRAAMMIQPFPPWVAIILIYTLPAAELAAAGLLICKATEFMGYWLSFILMAEFTGYVALVLVHFWNELPCSCGGVLGHLSWGPHLIFNLIFLVITMIGLYIKILERRVGDRK